MRLRLQFVATTLVLSASVACSPESLAPATDRPWVGTITTEGNVTTVINESGSVWGGSATLIEEVSIGLEAGDDEYMFGYVTGVYADEDRIFVVDQRVPAVHVYDYGGRHLRNIGREGQGPGEFLSPCDITVAPDGRIFVLGPAANNGRISVFGPEGEPVDTWPVPRGFQCRAQSVATGDGLLWLFAPIMPGFEIAIRAFGAAGPVGEPLALPDFEYERWTLTSRGQVQESAIPYAPQVSWTISPVGAMVAGASADYTFQVLYPDGAITRVARAYVPVPVIDEEREYWTLLLPRRIPNDETFRWDGRLPAVKPPFEEFLATHSAEIWVLREGPARSLPDCDPSELIEGRRGPIPRRCFEQTWTIDAFEVGGRYLGEVTMPGGAILGGDVFGYTDTFVRGNTVIATAQDDAGTIMVKRYRLELPGEER